MADPRPRPVLYINAALVFLQLLTAGAAFTDTFGQKFSALAIVAIAAVQGAFAFYQQSVVTPIAAPRAADGVPLVRADG
jgi:hypothetical protein